MSAQATDLPGRINCAIWAWYGFVAVYALFSTPFHALKLLLEGRWFAPNLLFSAMVAAIAAIAAWRLRSKLAAFSCDAGRRLAAIPAGRWLTYIIVGGILLRVLYLLVFPTSQISDGASYTGLAERLSRGESYYTASTYANWPPGLPFFLALHYVFFGVKPWVVPLSNLLLYSISIVIVYRLGREIGGDGTARVATLLLAIWPNYVMCTGLADKELLVIPLMAGGLMAYIQSARSIASGRRLGLAALTGVLLGAASLTQPSLMLFPAMVVVYELARGGELRRAFVRLVFLGVGMIAIISPWTVRNYLVLGAFVPISTAGGKTFYGANNEIATGGNIPKTPRDLDQFDELTGSRMGFKWGWEWISENPWGFIKLVFAKQIGFLGDDSDGAYWGIKRAGIKSGIAFIALKGVSNAYWMFIMLLSFTVVLVHWRSRLGLSPDISLLMMSLLYVFIIDSVFEAGSRHHTQMMGALAVVAALLAHRAEREAA